MGEDGDENGFLRLQRAGFCGERHGKWSKERNLRRVLNQINKRVYRKIICNIHLRGPP